MMRPLPPPNQPLGKHVLDTFKSHLDIYGLGLRQNSDGNVANGSILAFTKLLSSFNRTLTKGKR